MSFQDVRPGQGRRQQTMASSAGSYYSHNGGRSTNPAGTSRAAASSRTGVAKTGARSDGGFGSMGPLRTGGVGVSGPASGSLHQGGVSFGPAGRHTDTTPATGGRTLGSSGGGKVGDHLMSYSQNVSMLNGMVQQLGTTRDTAELRGQCRCQVEVIDELREKIQTEIRTLQHQAEGASRQEAARLGAMSSKLTKDFNRVNAIALDLRSQTERRMREVDTERRRLEEEDSERARTAFGGVGDERQQSGLAEVQQRRQQRERLRAEEEAVNTAIIQETEEELHQINKSLYKVNEIYRELATLVDQQQESVDIIDTNTEGAHTRAQEGLIQVQKASDYQTTCSIS